MSTTVAFLAGYAVGMFGSIFALALCRAAADPDGWEELPEEQDDATLADYAERNPWSVN